MLIGVLSVTERLQTPVAPVATSAQATTAASSALAGDLAVAHATLQAKHKDTLLTLARLQNSKATITYQIDHLKDRLAPCAV